MDKLTVSNSDIQGFSFEPILSTVNYSVTAYGFMYTLNPKDDLTPIELWNIHLWVESARNSYSFYNNNLAEKLWDEAKRLKIDRHFDECQVDFSNGGE